MNSWAAASDQKSLHCGTMTQWLFPFLFFETKNFKRCSFHTLIFISYSLENYTIRAEHSKIYRPCGWTQAEMESEICWGSIRVHIETASERGFDQRGTTHQALVFHCCIKLKNKNGLCPYAMEKRWLKKNEEKNSWKFVNEEMLKIVLLFLYWKTQLKCIWFRFFNEKIKHFSKGK